MVKYGSLTCPFVDVRKEIRRIADAGFDYVELSIEPPENEPSILMAKKREIKALLKRHKLPVIAHTAWYMDFSFPFKPVRETWIADARTCMETARAFGAKIIIFHSYSTAMEWTRVERAKALKNTVESMKKLVRLARKYGLRVVLENSAEPGSIKEYKDFKYVVDRVPGLYVHIDIGHAHAVGGMKGVEKFLKGFRKKLLHVHLSDNSGKDDEHKALGKGKLDLKKTIKLLKSIGYDKTITFEVFRPNYIRDQIKSMKKFRALW